MIKIKDYLSQEDYNRTIKLLQVAKEKHGIDFYLLLKKVMFVGALVDYHQKRTSINVWISYEKLYERNYRLTYSNCNIEYFKSENGLLQTNFFGIKSELVLETFSCGYIDIYKAWIKYWKTHE